MPFSTITMKSRLVMSKTNKKNKIGDQKNLAINYNFLKVVVSNIRDAFDANHFTQQINVTQQTNVTAFYSIKKKIFWCIDWIINFLTISYNNQVSLRELSTNKKYI